MYRLTSWQHSLQPGLRWYLIIFDPLAFAPRRRTCDRPALSPLLVLQRSLNFTSRAAVLWSSPTSHCTRHHRQTPTRLRVVPCYVIRTKPPPERRHHGSHWAFWFDHRHLAGAGIATDLWGPWAKARRTRLSEEPGARFAPPSTAHPHAPLRSRGRLSSTCEPRTQTPRPPSRRTHPAAPHPPGRSPEDAARPRRTKLRMQEIGYERFKRNNIRIRYWSWYYRGCWHQTCPPIDTHRRF